MGLDLPGIGPIDLGDVAFWARPPAERNAAYAALRRHAPFAHFAEPAAPGAPAGPGFWTVARHADVALITSSPEVWCSSRGAFTIPDLPAPMLEFYGSMIHLDDPRHARLRALVNRAFTPRMLESLLPWIRSLAAELVDGIAGRTEPFDLVAEVAAPFPMRVICGMMGIPDERLADVVRLTAIMTAGSDPELLPTDHPVEVFLRAGAEMAELVRALAEERAKRPTGDLTSALLGAEVDGERLTPAEIASFFILLVAAGSETTRNAIAHGVHALTEHPDQKRRWLADVDGLLPTAIEEIVRFASPVVFMRRTATRDTQLGGHAFAAGAKVMMLYGSANRDETVFADAERFDVGRAPNPHLGFGAPGRHYCLGANLARREIGAMFRELLRKVPTLEVDGEPDRLLSNFLNGIKRLPVRIHQGLRDRR
jgi:methyl-branched lipid omega-hydroxylase